MELLKVDEQLLDVLENPENYEIELCSTSLEVLKDIGRKVYNMQKNIEARIMQEMESENATKLPYLNVAGEHKVATLKPGAMKLSVDNAEELIRSAGFDINEFGHFEYKLLPWSKLQAKYKLGGKNKELIDKLYIRGKKSLSLGDK